MNDPAKFEKETRQLMITTVGKEEGQIFTRKELLNFPCEELRAIDGLWVKHSNGRFGFSVQKRIYVECGGKLDGKDPSTEVLLAFGDRVGWRKNNEWLEYSQLDPSFSSPQIVFPIFWVLEGGSVFFWTTGMSISSIFSRTEACDL